MTTYKRVDGDYVIVTVDPTDTVKIQSSTLSVLGNVIGNNIVASTTFKTSVFANTTARDAAITAPEAGMIIYLTSTGKFQGYVGSPTNAWQDFN